MRGRKTDGAERYDHRMTSDLETLGVINPNELYTLDAIKRRVGIKDATLRAARRNGLPVHYRHGRGGIYGADLIAYVRSPREADRE